MIDVQEILRNVDSENTEQLFKLIKENNLYIKNGKIFGKSEILKNEIAYWDKRQLVRKILLNSAYGALLNQHCRFFDKRLGQSVTLCGRQIVKHQSSKTNELITGEYQFDGDAVIAGDTDSTYFSAWSMIKPDVLAGTMEWNKDIVIKLYRSIGEQVNESFPAFMEKAFHAPRRQGEIIKTARELVA